MVEFFNKKKQVLFFRDFSKLASYYKKNKNKVFKRFLISVLFFVLSLISIGVKFFFPFHFYLSIIFLIISIYFFTDAFLFSREGIKKSNLFKFLFFQIKKHKLVYFSAFLIIFLLFILKVVTPFGDNPFESMNDEQVEKYVHQDMDRALVLLDELEIYGNELLESDLLLSSSYSLTDRENMELLWNNFLGIIVVSEEITDVHKHFNKISYFKNKEIKLKSFLISYSLYIKKYELIHRLINKTNGNEYVKKVLNENVDGFGPSTFSGLVSRFYDSNTLIRRNLGFIYLYFFVSDSYDSNYGEPYKILRLESQKSYKYLVKNFNTTVFNGVKAEKDNIENGLFKTWFPVQKSVAGLMGNLYFSSRDEKFISIDQIDEMKKALSPGDILLQRRNWYASNIGIPGFWPHSAIYIGDIKEANEYFAEIFPFENFSDFYSLVHELFPRLYDDYVSQDENKYNKAVIEGMSPGIILQSLEKSARADYLAVLRPNLTKTDKLKAILRAFENYNKPYDYNFDFETRDELVCSELIYDAFLPSENKKGVNFKLNFINGRKILSPTDMVAKYYSERYKKDSELFFVYFLDGNEKLKKAFIKGEAEFATTWTRPKYDWSQE